MGSMKIASKMAFSQISKFRLQLPKQDQQEGKALKIEDDANQVIHRCEEHSPLINNI